MIPRLDAISPLYNAETPCHSITPHTSKDPTHTGRPRQTQGTVLVGLGQTNVSRAVECNGVGRTSVLAIDVAAFTIPLYSPRGASANRVLTTSIG